MSSTIAFVIVEHSTIGHRYSMPPIRCVIGNNLDAWAVPMFSTTATQIFSPISDATKYQPKPSNISSISRQIVANTMALLATIGWLSISMPVLATVNEFNTNSDALMNLLLPNLTIVVSEDFAIENSDALMTISMPRLRIVEGDVSIKDNGVLTTISLPSLFRSDYITIENLPSLTEIDVPVLERINGDFRLIESDALVDFSMPVLIYVQSNVVFENNDALTSISMPVLTSVDYAFAIQGNPVLTSVSMPVLATVNEFTITNRC